MKVTRESPGADFQQFKWKNEFLVDYLPRITSLVPTECSDGVGILSVLVEVSIYCALSITKLCQVYLLALLHPYIINLFLPLTLFMAWITLADDVYSPFPPDTSTIAAHLFRC